jgi:hypothetical protein
MSAFSLKRLLIFDLNLKVGDEDAEACPSNGQVSQVPLGLQMIIGFPSVRQHVFGR